MSLVDDAARVRENAYVPYSRFKVGAAIRSTDGNLHLGVNVENASFGLTICAERTAVFNAVSQGKRRFLAIAIASPDACPPCGACRQVLNEFQPDMIIYLGDENGKLIHETRLAKLLPDAFGPENLG